MGYTDSTNTDIGVLVIGRVGALCGNVHEVTGKLDVREAAVNLPDEPKELAENEELLENGDDLPLETDEIPEEASA